MIWNRCESIEQVRRPGSVGIAGQSQAVTVLRPKVPAAETQPKQLRMRESKSAVPAMQTAENQFYHLFLTNRMDVLPYSSDSILVVWCYCDTENVST
jgi:hypothetical protein